ncbi:MAG: hypothetical protein HYR62_02035 [Actinobacteria bacterium]|nr:hypothetical protein [Actinomycetota bacterium]MBI3687263.1 hypothetical protein [Actinomycetota bacterium]
MITWLGTSSLVLIGLGLGLLAFVLIEATIVGLVTIIRSSRPNTTPRGDWPEWAGDYDPTEGRQR